MILFNLIVCCGVLFFSVLARPVTMNWSAVAWCATATCLFLSPEEQWGSVDAPQPPRPLPKNRLSVGIAFVLCSCMREAKGRHRILLLKSHWIQCEERTPFLFPHQKHCTQPLACEALLAFSRRVAPPFFCKTTTINQNPISQQRQLLLEWQMFRGHLQLAFQLFYSLSFPLSLILLRRCRRLLSFRHEIDTPGSAFCANSPPAATADFTNDGEMARRAKG